jgi:prepilin-type N-terminal cleavage/methylation domain-containing protein
LKNKGFTLIELIIVIAIVGILTATGITLFSGLGDDGTAVDIEYVQE